MLQVREGLERVLACGQLDGKYKIVETYARCAAPSTKNVDGVAEFCRKAGLYFERWLIRLVSSVPPEKRPCLLYNAGRCTNRQCTRPHMCILGCAGHGLCRGEGAEHAQARVCPVYKLWDFHSDLTARALGVSPSHLEEAVKDAIREGILCTGPLRVNPLVQVEHCGMDAFPLPVPCSFPIRLVKPEEQLCYGRYHRVSDPASEVLRLAEIYQCRNSFLARAAAPPCVYAENIIAIPLEQPDGSLENWLAVPRSAEERRKMCCKLCGIYGAAVGVGVSLGSISASTVLLYNGNPVFSEPHVNEGTSLMVSANLWFAPYANPSTVVDMDEYHCTTRHSAAAQAWSFACLLYYVSSGKHFVTDFSAHEISCFPDTFADACMPPAFHASFPGMTSLLRALLGGDPRIDSRVHPFLWDKYTCSSVVRAWAKRVEDAHPHDWIIRVDEHVPLLFTWKCLVDAPASSLLQVAGRLLSDCKDQEEEYQVLSDLHGCFPFFVNSLCSFSVAFNDKWSGYCFMW